MTDQPDLGTLAEQRLNKTDTYVKQVNILFALDKKFKRTHQAYKKFSNVSRNIRTADLIQMLRDNKSYTKADDLESQYRQVLESRDKLQEIKNK